MVYKNKNIKSNYSVIFVVFIVGAIMTGAAVLIAIGGLFSTSKTLKNVQHIDTAFQDSGNHAGHAVYFDITEAPVFLSKEKKSYYYLVTDGNEYRVAEIDEEDYEEIKSAVEATGTYHIEGRTHYIVDSDTRSEIASRAESITGQSMTDKTMDDILGDVCIEYMKINFWNLYKSGFGLAGIILGLIGAFILSGSLGELKASRKVISLSNITAKDIDEEACKADSLWLNGLRIYLTENMVLGILSDGKYHEGQVALRYDEIQRIYSYNTNADDIGPNSHKSYIVEAIATDGNKYTLADSRNAIFSDDLIPETEELYKRIKDKNPNVLCEPENVRYKKCRFSYNLVDYDGDDVLTETLDEDDKQEIIMHFDYDNLAAHFKPADAIVSMKMSFPEDGIVEITTGYFGDREKEVEPALYNFLKGQLMDGWGEGYEYGDFVISFRESDADNL